MKNLKLFFCSSFLYLSFSSSAQTDSLYVEIDATQVVVALNTIVNRQALQPFYQKLTALQASKNGKLNIVHLGDSHIQADLFSGMIRSKLQEHFGNGGRGFVFPHSLAKTNGSSDLKFSSNQSWESQRNIYPDNGSPVGLSGIALYTKATDFAIEMQVRTPNYAFNNLKIITPQNQKMFEVALTSKTIKIESEIPKNILHTIKNGESLSVIAEKYKVTISQIKKENGLKSSQIRAGKKLKIPSQEKAKKVIERSEFIPLETIQKEGYHEFITDSLLQKIYIIPALNQTDFALNGLVLENNYPGIIYHSIGVNGAKCSDFNKFPMFFEQLSILKPDLIIISLGTNESFDKLITEDYSQQLVLMIESILIKNPSTAILLTTPPPSQFKRKFPNSFVADYTKQILIQAEEKNYAVWDLFSNFGGLFGINQLVKEGLIGSDRVHYTKLGYEQQGELFTKALLESFVEFKEKVSE